MCLMPLSLHEVLLLPGNCIVSAISHCLPDTTELIAQVSDASHPPNAAALSRRARTYKAVASLTGVTLVAHHGMVLDGPGDYLVHSECAGDPHCVLVRVMNDDTNSALVIDGAACYCINVPDLRCCGNDAVDASTLVTFRI